MKSTLPSILAVIPARYASTRFPGKPLVQLEGKTMIQHVYERVSRTPSLEGVLVATEDRRIYDAVEHFGGRAVMTSADHKTGTDRIVEAVKDLECEWVLNVQGDEPLIDTDDLETLIQKTLGSEAVRAATLVVRFEDEARLHDQNVVKTVLNLRGEALYFSRSLLPFPRNPQRRPFQVWRHLGVYLFRKDLLLQFHQWPQTPLEKTEQLEQLRLLERGERMLCVQASSEAHGVDVPTDVDIAESLLRGAPKP